MFIEIFSLIVLVILVIFVIGVIIALAIWPGRIARARNHPFADAINVAGWVSILAGGVLWPLALVWAYATPGNEPCLDYSIEEDEL
jgi:hypothetical protein